MHSSGIPISKRIFDLLLTALVMIVLSPVFLVISILNRISIGTPVLFKQMRPGYCTNPFWIYKFRTMTEKLDENGNLLPDDKRITRLGKFLRTTSLDELPELWNILRGEMSLVGPRPLLMDYLSRYSEEQIRRHEVLPGITGWAQIHGRNLISWDDKFQYDVWYVDNRTFWLDIKIISITFWKVLKREGINQPGHATSEEFFGNSQQSGHS